MSNENLTNLIRDMIGRLERIEDAGATPTRPTRRTESTAPVPIAQNRRHQHQCQDSEVPGPSCSTMASTLPCNRRRFYPYNPPERNHIFRPSHRRQNSHPKTKKN